MPETEESIECGLEIRGGGSDTALGSSPPVSSLSSLRSLSSSVSRTSSDGSILERQSASDSRSEADNKVFSPAEYLNMHRAALEERSRVGSASRKMRGLYR